ncbi:hypothetical protein ACP70R_035082 [Stipagrostis hirtigluma subsp. patula]
MLPFSLQCFLVLFFFFPASDAEEFIYSGFTDAELTFEGEASIDRGRLRLTSGLDIVGIGHAFYKYPISFRKLTSYPIVPSFTTSFVFTITSDDEVRVPQGKGGDVFAFVISSTNEFLNGSLPGQYLGLFNSTNRNNASRNILAIELGTIMKPKFNYTDDNHVAISINNLILVNSHTAGYYTTNSGFQSWRLTRENEFQLWIEYDGKVQQLNVTLGSPWSPKPRHPLLSSPLNLSSLLPISRKMGKLHNSTTLRLLKDGKVETEPGLPVNISQEIVRSHRNMHMVLPVSIVAAFILIVAFTVLGYVYTKRHLEKAVMQSDLEINCGPPFFTYKDLFNATGGFKNEMLLGKGGFGKVYKGSLPATKQNIAIKRIAPESKQGMKEFISEITILGHVRHRSLVRLLGYCRHKHELLLVYDYMPNGSLDKYLCGQDRMALGWCQRFRIIKDVASGLLYLHEEWEHVVIHRDIKSSNVLLDDEMNGRLGDFGLARLHDHGVDAHTTRVAGTYGYIAPELARLGKATKATDVFAFGVFIMEVICGRRPIEVNARGEPQVLADHVINAWENGSIINCIDPRLEDCVAQEAEMVLKLGLLCSHPSPKVRPGMRLVMQYLEAVVTLPDFPLSFFSVDAANDEVYDQFVASYPSAATTITSLSGGR